MVQMIAGLLRTGFFVGAIFIAAIFSYEAQASRLNKPAGVTKSKLAKKGDLELRQLVTPIRDFESLPRDRRLYVYYLSQAIEAGRDIVWLQLSPKGLPIRQLLEGVWEHKSHFTNQDVEGLEEYMFRLYHKHGNYDDRAGEKFVPVQLTSEKLFSMARIADSANADAGISTSLELQARMLERHIFDPDYLKKLKPDDLTQSAAQFYSGGVRYQEELEAAEALYARRVARDADSNPFILTYPYREKQRGEIQFLTARIGGVFSDHLQMVDHVLAKAHTFANEEEKEILSALRRTMATGDFRDALEADKKWVKYKSRDFNFVIGFIDTYDDPLDRRASWEGFILLRKKDPETIARVTAIRQHAVSYFEPRMPVNGRYKKRGDFTPPEVEASYLVFSGGRSGESPFAGVNLPNDNGIRASHGSKSFTAYNVTAALSGDELEKPDWSIEGVFFAPRYHDFLPRVNHQMASDMLIEFHEVLGHGSGRVEAGVKETDLGAYYSPLEEGRAEVAALYFGLDPDLRRLGIVPEMSDDAYKEFQTYLLLKFFTSHLRSYVSLSDTTTTIRQAHQWARQVMLNWLLHHKALEIVESDRGLPLIRVTDLNSARRALGELWWKIQDIKSKAELSATKQARAREFLQNWGLYTEQHKKWRESFLATYRELGIPTKGSIFINPVLEPIRNKAGEIIDVKLTYHSPESGIGLAIERQIQASKENQRRCQDLLSSSAPRGYPWEK